MTIDRLILIIAGTFIMASIILSQYHNINWLYFTGFVAINMFQAGFTRWCLMAKILKKIGFKPAGAVQ